MVPSATFQKESINIGTIFWCYIFVKLVLFRENLKINADFINRDNEFSGVILFHTC